MGTQPLNTATSGGFDYPHGVSKDETSDSRESDVVVTAENPSSVGASWAGGFVPVLLWNDRYRVAVASSHHKHRTSNHMDHAIIPQNTNGSSPKVQYSTVQHNTVQHSTVPAQHSTTQHNTVQYSTVNQ